LTVQLRGKRGNSGCRVCILTTSPHWLEGGVMLLLTAGLDVMNNGS
jgi:hypothetical protein